MRSFKDMAVFFLDKKRLFSYNISRNHFFGGVL